MRRLCVVVCSVVLSLSAWGGPKPSLPREGEQRCTSRGVGLDSRCLVNGVNLHFVDWGGTGGDLVLVAGLDDSARVYDELAALLRQHHRVIGVTRRGFCGSDMPPDGYAAARGTVELDYFDRLDSTAPEIALAGDRRQPAAVFCRRSRRVAVPLAERSRRGRDERHGNGPSRLWADTGSRVSDLFRLSQGRPGAARRLSRVAREGRRLFEGCRRAVGGAGEGAVSARDPVRPDDRAYPCRALRVSRAAARDCGLHRVVSGE